MLAIAFSGGIESAFADVATFVPKLLAFLVILVVGIFIAKLVAKAADKVLERVGFDKAVERGGVKKALDKSKYDASDLVGKLIFYAILLLVLTTAFGVFGPNPVSDLLQQVITYIPKVIAALLIVVVASAIAGAVKEMIEASLGGLSYGKTLAAAASGAIVLVGVFAALSQLRIAPEIINGLFYALIAIVAGSAIIAIGGGGITPMRGRWEKVLAKYDAEAPRMREQSQGAKERMAERAQERKEQAKPDGGVATEPRNGRAGGSSNFPR